MNSQPAEACPAPVLGLFGARLEKAIPTVKIHTDTSAPPPQKKSQVKPACSQRGRQPEDRVTRVQPFSPCPLDQTPTGTSAPLIRVSSSADAGADFPSQHLQTVGQRAPCCSLPSGSPSCTPPCFTLRGQTALCSEADY